MRSAPSSDCDAVEAQLTVKASGAARVCPCLLSLPVAGSRPGGVPWFLGAVERGAGGTEKDQAPTGGNGGTLVETRPNVCVGACRVGD